MQMINLPLDQLREALWNPNQMDEAILQKLRESLSRYGLVQNLVVRPLDEDLYEVLSGNQRLQILRESGHSQVPCVVKEVNDAHARLLAQALNRIQGEDDLGLKGELLREVLEELSQEDVLALLPETASSLQALASLGQESMADYLQAWQKAQGARLKHLQFQLTPVQLEVVQEALEQLLPTVTLTQNDSPNRRGTALYFLCLRYLEREAQPV